MDKVTKGIYNDLYRLRKREENGPQAATSKKAAKKASTKKAPAKRGYVRRAEVAAAGDAAAAVRQARERWMGSPTDPDSAHISWLARSLHDELVVSPSSLGTIPAAIRLSLIHQLSRED